MKGVELKMKRRWKSGSSLVEKLFDKVEEYKKIEIKCCKNCKEILKNEKDLDELYHAKAVLEQRMKSKENLQNIISNTFNLVAIILSVIAMVISLSNGKVGKMDIGCFAVGMLLVCVTIYYLGDNSPINKYMYYVYSLICAEIEDRKSCNENAKNKKKKEKRSRCQNKSISPTTAPQALTMLFGK
jgi:hypothetical protein